MLRFHSLRVADVRPDAEDAVGISLQVPEELRDEYRGSAGQHVVLRTQIDGEETRRTYSLVNAPGEWPLRIVARVHPAGRMSRYLAEQLHAGEHIDVLPPNGSFTPRLITPEARTYAAFAAGCGITPALSVMRSVLKAHANNRVILFYGNGSSARTMCLEELLALKDRYLGRLSLHFVMSREPQEAALYNGRIDAAKVRRLAQTLFKPDAVAEYFVCGPGNMIEQVSATLRELGVESDRVHGEHFTVDTVSAEAAAATAPHSGTADRSVAGSELGSAEVTIIMDGRRRSFSMRMNDENVLEAAARAGLELPFSCRAGVCSTCRTKVVRGAVDMAQNYALEDWELEQGYVLACQSRVKTPQLELDYDEK
ncbi:MAG: 2Fe-2S iron-sulfur cluster binding domain-containing protein [Gammaproteobacteria bacterium]|nr:MAG: 2Fe-2S iron-sulfur cluster binding domain-containing protein [Gammaproteobacteria bacterium]